MGLKVLAMRAMTRLPLVQSAIPKPIDAELNPLMFHCSPMLFRVLWLFIVLLHFFTGILLIPLLLIYLMMDVEATKMTDYGIEYNRTVVKSVQITIGLLALSHFYSVGDALTQSIRSGQLTFHGPGGCCRQGRVQEHKTARPKSAWRRWYQQLSIRGDNFEVAMMLREVVEVTTQSYQCYRMSRSIPSVWVNRGGVAAIVANSWSTPLIALTLQRKLALCRLACMLIDITLDVTTSVLVPFMILLRIFLEDMNPNSSPFDTTTIVRSVSELQSLVLHTPTAVIAQFLPVAMMLLSIRDVKAFIVRQDPSVAPTPTFETTKLPALPVQSLSARNPIAHRIHNVVHILFAAYGFILVGVQIQAEAMSVPPTGVRCQLTLQPWVAERQACALVVVDCALGQLNGTRDEMSRVLDVFDSDMMTGLTFVRCPYLEIPPVLQELTMLQHVEIVHSTMAQWDADAAISETIHSRLTDLYMVHVNFSLVGHALPAGVTTNMMPATLARVVIVECDLRELPAVLGSVWSHRLAYLYFEHCTLEQVPEEVINLNVATVLSFGSNNLVRVPSAVFQRTVDALLLQDNPLTELPQLDTASAPLPKINLLNLVNTSIVAPLPTWLGHSNDSSVPVNVFAMNTPLCTTNRSASSSAAGGLNCTASGAALASNRSFPTARWLKMRDL